MADVHVRIGKITVPAGRNLDPEDLARRVERELAELLALDAAVNRQTAATADRTLTAPGGQVRAASAATPASLAHAIARHVHAGLRSGGTSPR
ncbi:MAG TPA: hypothetical protein VN238_20220 [Solirubrobacteraceae bacterium]|nr:hypothetical protein [Solirubrobacteraceae bacterium]